MKTENLPSAQERQSLGSGLAFKRFFTKPGVHPLDEIKYSKRSSVITNPDGSVVFKMENVEVPENWSQLATDIVVSKYFRKAGVPETGSEISARQVVYRIEWPGLSLDEKREGCILPCVAYPVSDVVLTLAP